MPEIYIQADEMFPHYDFYPDEEGWMPDWYVGKGIQVSDTVFQELKEIRDKSIILQDTLKQLADSNRHRS